MSRQEQNDRHIIWSDLNLDLDDWRESLEELYPDYPEDELYDIMVKSNAENLYDERVNLDIQLSQPIIVVGDLGRWNGRVSGYKMIDSGNIKDCLFPIPITPNGMWTSTATFEPTPFITTAQTIIYTVYSKTVLPIRRLKICKIKSTTEKPQEPTSHELPKGSAMILPEYMAFLFQSKDNQTNKRGDINGLQSIDRSRAKYTFSQSQQLSMQTGLIGYLRADFGSAGNEFWTTWNDFRKDLKTDEFKAEFDDVINGLRDGDVLSDRKAMSSYCYSTPDSSFNDDRNHYGIRLATEKYSYLMRFNPNRGEYNLYCYCYQKEWLNSHLKMLSVVSALSTRTIRSSFALRTERKFQLSSATAKQWIGLADILTTTTWRSVQIFTTFANLPSFARETVIP